MNENQKAKRNFRSSKKWKKFKVDKKKEFKGLDAITLKPLRKTWNLHHEDLNEENYMVLNDNFLPCNNLTHKVIHWLWTYWKNDKGILDRLKKELEKMEAVNEKKNEKYFIKSVDKLR